MDLDSSNHFVIMKQSFRIRKCATEPAFVKDGPLGQVSSNYAKNMLLTNNVTQINYDVNEDSNGVNSLGFFTQQGLPMEFKFTGISPQVWLNTYVRTVV